jgi:hypothetical protein
MIHTKKTKGQMVALTNRVIWWRGYQAFRLEVVLQNLNSYDSGIQYKGMRVILGQAPVGEAFWG